MANALFISANYIYNNSVINSNVDEKYIIPTIDLCQKMYLIPILGTALYDEIKGQIIADTLTSDNTTLLNDYIQDVLLYYVLFEGIAIFTYKIENKSVVKKNGETAQPIDSQEVQMLRDMYKDRAEFFAERCTKYLLENATTSRYASYLTGNDGIDDINPIKNNYTSGWVFDETTKIKSIEISPSERDIARYWKI